MSASDAPVAPGAAVAPPPMERLTRTFLFSDIEGSSRLERELGTEVYARVRSRHRELLRDAFRRAGGEEQGTEGDSFFVVFTSADAALRAAVDGQRSLAAEPWPDGRQVAVRIGIHTGETSMVDGDLIGIEINRAARVAAAANGGQIVVSEVTRALLSDATAGSDTDIELRDLGIHRLKDFDPGRLFDVVAAGLPSSFPPLRSGGSPFSGLPAQRTAFVGRAREVGEVRSLLLGRRLVTLTGPGGTGKTRLAIAAAQSVLGEFPGGTAWIGLASISDPALVGPAIAAGLAVLDEGLRPLGETIAERIGGERILLVLDNFEQVAPAAALVGELLAACPALVVLVTSRGLLHLAGEQEYPVPALGLPDPAADPTSIGESEAVALFVERARAVRPAFELDATNATAVAAICARLDGLPLAIELAAARVRLLTPAAIRERLDRSIGLLAGGAQDLPDRQRTLRGAVAWSHDLLDPTSRTMFARLSVFAGGSTLDAAEAIVDADGALGIDVLDGLATLADQSLIRSEEGVDGEPRFRMLNVIREFGLEQLAASGELEAIRDRHLAYFGALAERAEPELVAADTRHWLDVIEIEHDNVRAALRWAIESGQVEAGMALGGRLWRFWHQRGHLGQGLAILRELLAAPGAAAPTPGRAKALNGAGGLAYWQNDFPVAQAYYEEYLELVRSLGDRTALAEAFLNLGFMSAIARDYDRALAEYAQSRDLFAESGGRGAISARIGSAMVLHLSGRAEEALAAVGPMIEEARRIGDRYWLASALGVEGRARMALRDDDRARAVQREALVLFHEAGDPSGVATQLWDLGELAALTGHPGRALTLAGASLALRDRIAGGAPPMLTQQFDIVAVAGMEVAPEAARVALASGRELETSDAVAFALSDADLPVAAPAPEGEPAQ
ncbi:MAG TPA: adenylate/guanylate cyclase domain-containing protein [Candidatus Limnocylindrales bacterium]|nr:adenylate/guanylate cyclase domain-containing protein [Candidatus Limnocylindrales bacterium]